MILALAAIDKIMSFGLLMSFFMVLAIPFASILLLSWVRESISGSKRLLIAAVLLLALPAALAAVVPSLLKSDYSRFIEKDQRYYSRFARACDSALGQRPSGTYEFIFIPATNVSLPKIIQDWHPNRLTYGARGLDILVGSGRAGFVISWHQPEGETNLWVLETSGEVPEQRLYSETKFYTK
jgi:apolipoprotein N-acyltransferase